MINHNFVVKQSIQSINGCVTTGRGVEGQCQTFNAMIRYDLDDGSYQRYDYGDGVYGNETSCRLPAPARKPMKTRPMPWCLPSTPPWKSECLVFKADDISEPIARVKIPRRVATGFHTTWVPGHLFCH